MRRITRKSIRAKMTMRMTFRPVAKRDFDRLNEIVNDPDVSHYLDVNCPAPMKSTGEFFEHCKRENGFWYCIIVDGEIAGSFSLMPFQKGTKRGHVARFGIAIAKEYWGRDLGDAAIDYAISMAEDVGIKRLELMVAEENLRARELYEDNGFLKEGVAQKAYKIGKRYQNGIMMGLWLD